MPAMQTRLPARKVYGSTAAAALATLVLGLIRQMTEIDLSPEIEGALMTLIVFAAGYLTPPAMIDPVVVAPAQPEEAP